MHNVETQNESKRNNHEFLRTIYFNTGIIRNKFQEIQAYTKSKNLDITGITGTSLNSGEFEAEFNIVGFKNFHQNRNYKKGAGDLLYVKNNGHVYVLEKVKQDAHDTLLGRIDKKKDKNYVDVIYRLKTLSIADNKLLFQELISATGTY